MALYFDGVGGVACPMEPLMEGAVMGAPAWGLWGFLYTLLLIGLVVVVFLWALKLLKELKQ